MSLHRPAETIEVAGCSVELRRVDGPIARELFFHCRSTQGPADAAQQAGAIYTAALAVLSAEGGGFDSVGSETIFLRDLKEDVQPLRAARQEALSAGDPPPRPATLEIEQPPLLDGSRVEVSMQATLPRDAPPAVDIFEANPDCPCAECARCHGRRTQLGDELRFQAAALYGAGKDAYEQTLAVLGVADDLLQQAGFEIHDVVRTWIHLRDIDRDYADLNRARRHFFEERGVDPPPASTGIGGGPVPAEHDLCLGVYAVRRTRGSARERSAMSTPTLNDATQYGSDFTRGMRIREANKIALHVSGTASIDEAGRTVHVEDLDAQIDRMLVNIEGLLERQGATFRDVVSAVTYLKRPEDAARLRARLAEAGFTGFPNALVAANVCRPDLLCEAELLAVLPRPGERHR